MFRILNLYNSPWVKTTSDLLPLHLDQLVGANHSEGNTCLGGELQTRGVHKEGEEEGNEIMGNVRIREI